jgi:hypothetical protein
MKKKLYLLVLRDCFILGGIQAMVGRHFYLELKEEDGTYEITHGMTYGDTWNGFNRIKPKPSMTHINFVNDYIKKGYIELVEDPTIYE